MVEEVNKKEKLWRNIVIVLIIVLIILAVGWFFKKEKERKIIKDIENKRIRLKEVEDRINVLQAIKEKIERNEKKYLLISRILIGAILITANCLYIFFFVSPITSGTIITGILNINEIILLVYSFIAFITYGSINLFVSAIKSEIAHIFRKNHISSLEELELLIKEKYALKEEINYLSISL